MARSGRQRDIQALLADTSDAPPTLKRIAEIVGWPAAMKLSLALGAKQLYVPRDLTSIGDGHALIWSIGRTATLSLIDSEFGGGTLFVPGYAGRRLKCLEIARGYAEGMSVAVLAEQHRITSRQVYGVIRAEEERLAALETE